MLIILMLISFITPFTLNCNVGTYGFAPFANDYFVETGSFNGDGILKALKANCFKQIYSIEAIEAFANNCKYRFHDRSNVQIIHGDSKDKLWDVIKGLNSPITFWLDAHIYPPIYDEKDGRKNAPIMEELEQIKRHHIKTHTILIDDMSCCGTLAFDYVTKDDLINKIKEINPNYTITFLVGGDADEAKDNILFACIK